ncbi:MAG: hypothetical protein NTX82_06030 [Candidatus Parcubacteria bacterium]|nr:hypothetical protein [Candidatus Parcubacteria bacterium]
MKWSIVAIKLRELIARNQFVLYLAVFGLAFFCYLWIQSTASLVDPDSFYHLKMVKLIAERGPILDFPWLQFTVLKNYYTDHHFLYHVAAIPFVSIMGDFVGFKYYTAFLAALFIVLCYWFFKKQKIKGAEFFTLILLFAPAFMFRISLTKATAFSLILLFLGIYFIFQKKYWPLFLVAFLYVWSYGGYFLILGMALIYVAADTIYLVLQKKFEDSRKIWQRLNNIIKNTVKYFFGKQHLKLLGIIALGLALGIVINPYFPKNLYFIWQQLVQIGLINYQGVVNVGGEWYPYRAWNLISDINLVALVGFIAYVIFIFSFKKQQTKLYFFLLTSVLFLILTLKSKRYVEYLVPNLVFFAAFSINFASANYNLSAVYHRIKNIAHLMKYLVMVILLYLGIVVIAVCIRNGMATKQAFNGGIGFQNFAGVSQYLKTNAQPGQIIMHTDWDDFPMLFYNNDRNYYIVGLDPTFMYNYNKDLYNLYADITTAKKKDNLYQAVKVTFKASYFIVNKDRAQLKKNLENDGGFVMVYEDGDCWLYQVK